MGINRDVLKSSDRVRQKRLSTFFAYLVLALAFTFALTSYLFQLEELRIKKVFITGNKNITAAKIFEVVGNSIDGRYYGIYPKTNVLIYPKSALRKNILRNFLWISDVKVSGYRNSLFIRVEEREPKYVWCDDLFKARLDRTCYFLDKNGLAFSRAPDFLGHIYLEFYGGDKRGGYMGRSVLPVDIFHQLIVFKDSLVSVWNQATSNLGFLYGIDIMGNGDYGLLFTDGEREWKINFNLSLPSHVSQGAEVIGISNDLTKDPARQFLVSTNRKLLAVVTSSFFDREIKQKNGRLEYIDLRFGKKAFFKFKDR